MFKTIVRITGFLLTVAGFVFLVIDGAATIGTGKLLTTPLGQTAFSLFPNSFPILQPAIERHVHPLLWDPLLLNFFLLPTFLALIVLGVLLLIIGRPRERPIGHPSRL